ncbi:MAG TPA: ester cyclase [Gemmatimonadales bacterium]|nr:ester cyclase [Gemmatimonadales bacterium]
MSAIDVARRYVAAWNARDAARLAATFREGGTYEDPNTGGPIGPGPLGGYASTLWSAFPDLEFEEVSWRQDGAGSLTFAWLMRGTNRGPLRGLPPTGATIALPGVDLISVCDDGVERVQGYFDRATLMDQLGVQSVVQPYAIGPVRFGVCSQVRSTSTAAPGAVALTMIEARSDEEVQWIRDMSRRIMLRLPEMPGFLSFQGAVVGRRLTTVTLWENGAAVRQVMREANHKQASEGLAGGEVGRAFHASTWTLERLGELWVRCTGCGTLRDARGPDGCSCGAWGEERPAFW